MSAAGEAWVLACYRPDPTEPVCLLAWAAEAKEVRCYQAIRAQLPRVTGVEGDAFLVRLSATQRATLRLFLSQMQPPVWLLEVPGVSREDLPVWLLCTRADLFESDVALARRAAASWIAPPHGDTEA